MDVFTCDLVASSKQHIRFLEGIHKIGISVRSPDQRSFNRYVNCWLPLVHNLATGTEHNRSSTKLIPPADIAWLWHCHRLAPQEYEKFMEKEFGSDTVLESSSPFSFQTPTSYGRDEMITQSIWRQYYPNESFFLQEEQSQQPQEQSPVSQQELVRKCKERLRGYCIFASAQGQRTLLWQVSEPWYLEDDFLQDGVDRYHQFLQLARVMDKKGLPLVPTFQIDLLWHTHILISNHQYNQDCLAICGRKFSHDDSFNDRSEGGDLEQAFVKTCELWKQQYGTEYWVNGAMYRGEPPEEYFAEYDTWDGCEWTVEYKHTSPLKNWFHESIAKVTRKVDPRRLLRQIKKQQHKRKLKNQSQSVPTPVITWNDLLMATGKDIWKFRKQAYVQSREDNGKALDHVRMPIYRKTSNKTHSKGMPGLLSSRGKRNGRRGDDEQSNSIRVVGDFALFQNMEARGMEKKESPATAPKSLTQEVGEEWTRQRELIAKRALSAVKEMSLNAVDQVNWDDILRRDLQGQQHFARNKVVDLKAMVVEACLDWMMRLFAGCSYASTTVDGAYAPLAKAFLDLWIEIRARQKNSASLKATQDKLLETIPEVAHNNDESRPGGIIHHIFRQKLTTEQAAMNCLNAMVAAFDAAVVVVFWALWNLARTKGAWEKCRNELIQRRQEDSCDDPDELEELAALKKAATEGLSYDCSHLSYLSRAMAETLRVFPPVWTLPRVEEDGQSFVQLDVAWTNHALDYCDWNPDRTEWLPLATFGVGKRHCPGGTAALFATRKLLRRFVEKYEIVECNEEHAIRSLYLGPTLSMEGPQYFELTPREEEERGSNI